MTLFSKSTGGGAAVRAALDPRAEPSAIDPTGFSNIPESREPDVLGLNPRTRHQELVGEDEIHARRNSARLVVMSGCNSGRGEILPGVGLLSLTRAWILSGATGVVASHWPVPDQSGLLFERFYRHSQRVTDHAAIANAKNWAAALQQAQIESIHDRIPASVWAAYFLTGRN